jgi:7-carboxy-7-deazaguanine synthase
MKGMITEIFDSIQGEGIYLGEKQLFVRFYGCNLKCKFCDTKLDGFEKYEPQELFEKLRQLPKDFHSISFTGGEPLLQIDFLKEMLTLTRSAGIRNYLETNGTLPDELEAVIDHLDIVAMDLKLPSSTDLVGYWETHRDFLKIASKKEVFLKAVICRSTRVKDLRDALKLIKEVNKSVVLVLQPNYFEDHGRLNEKLAKFKDICFKENITACVIPQVHKIADLK